MQQPDNLLNTDGGAALFFNPSSQATAGLLIFIKSRVDWLL